MLVMRCFAVALVAVFCSAAPDAGRAAESVRTEFDLDKCHHTAGSADEDYGSWLCEGYAGIAVYVTAGDQRSHMSYGRNAKAEHATCNASPASSPQANLHRFSSFLEERRLVMARLGVHG